MPFAKAYWASASTDKVPALNDAGAEVLVHRWPNGTLDQQIVVARWRGSADEVTRLLLADASRAFDWPT